MADGESNMALLEIGMISGYVPDRTSLHSLLEDPATKVKRFEEDRDIVTIYFDKLINQKTCISFMVTRENVVDRLEPANVKLYDYYQQELTISSSYSFAQTCSSATPSEEAEIPNPVPVEVDQNKDNTAKKAAKDETVPEKAPEIPDVQNGTVEQIEPRAEIGSGQAPDEPDINLNPVFDRLGPPNVDLEDMEESFSFNKQQGQDAFSTDFGGNPLFVVVDHELATPDGVEGPVPVSVKPDFVIFDNNPLSNMTNQTAEGIDVDSSNVSSQSSPSLDSTESCPLCADELPSNINEIYCSASSVVKAAIRRLRKARLLLDIQPREIKRLRSTIAFVLSSNCSCSPLDNPGSLALLMHFGDSEFATHSHNSRNVRVVALDEHISIYGLQPHGGIPDEIMNARTTCANRDDNASLNHPTAG